eukprot:3741988-Alexandrium_andersonii.AAC.1
MPINIVDRGLRQGARASAVVNTNCDEVAKGRRLMATVRCYFLHFHCAREHLPKKTIDAIGPPSGKALQLERSFIVSTNRDCQWPSVRARH